MTVSPETSDAAELEDVELEVEGVPDACPCEETGLGTNASTQRSRRMCVGVGSTRTRDPEGGW